MLHNPLILFPLIAAGTASAAVIWSRWDIRRAIRKEHVNQLEAEETQTVYTIIWSR